MGRSNLCVVSIVEIRLETCPCHQSAQSSVPGAFKFPEVCG
ncbi:unnamed protein product [Linum tenue]|uniref:Uncharacterized protein n=1 Tax=Linum tenue TaxID=586396 RepID=A0AAV0JVF1_9ROSI|nr:unnamed protein product [Linum tenue]